MPKSAILLWTCLIVIAVSAAGCAHAKYDESKRVVEYWRLGDQKTAGINIERLDPNGPTFRAAVDTQESKGELNIDRLAAAIAAAIIQTSGGTAP